MNNKNIFALAVLILSAPFLHAETVVMQKQNTAFSIDGNRGAIEGQQVYLWNTDTNNVNQQWVEVNQGGGYYSYQKNNTSLCLDGGNGAAQRQPVTLENCNNNEQDQHWRKVTVSDAAFRLEKRNTSYSIDGNRGAEQRQSLYLWNSSNTNVNQQWQFFSDNDEPTIPPGYVELDSISELRAAFANSNGRYVMKPGSYTVSSLVNNAAFTTYGSNNVFDFTGATIDVPTTVLRSLVNVGGDTATWWINGDNNTFIGGSFINTYPGGNTARVTNFKTINENRNNYPGTNNVYVKVWGDGNKFIDNTVTVRGSFPYGYGEIFGKGSSPLFGKNKHAGMLVVGDDTLIDGIKLTVLAFGHGIFMQGASNTIIRNSNLQGRMRLGADMYNDGVGSYPDRNNFQQYEPEWFRGEPINRNKMYSLTEDGIRAYGSGRKQDGSSGNTGKITIEDTTVANMRGCISLVAAKASSYVDNVEVRGCEGGFSLPNNGGDVVNSRGDAAFGDLISNAYGSAKNQNFDITVIETSNNVGDHALVQLSGSGHVVTLRSDGQSPRVDRDIRIGYSWVRWDWSGGLDNHNANNVTLTNNTAHPVDLTSRSRNTTGTSVGPVSDSGTNNDVD